MLLNHVAQGLNILSNGGIRNLLITQIPVAQYIPRYKQLVESRETISKKFIDILLLAIDN